MSRKVRRFEDLIAWQQGMDLAVEIYSISEQSPFSRDFALRDQIHKAAISVPSNIAEGFERGSRAEFHRFLSIAKGSCAELRTQLILANRIGYISGNAYQAALGNAETAARTIGKLRVAVAKQRATPLIPHAPCLMPEEPC